VSRHKSEHLPQVLAAGQAKIPPKQPISKRDSVPLHAVALAGNLAEGQARDEAHAIDLIAELAKQLARANLMSDACGRWLRDPADESRYEIGPRAGEIIVTYMEHVGEGQFAQRKAPLAALLARVEEHGGVKASETTTNHRNFRTHPKARGPDYLF
jgi:hypothetical protein